MRRVKGFGGVRKGMTLGALMHYGAWKKTKQPS